MNLAAILPKNITDINDINVIYNALADRNSANAIHYCYKDMNGNDIYKFNVNIIYLLDKYFTKNNNKMLSIEQERFVNKYLKEAQSKTEDEEFILTNLINQFDIFLGNYLGDNVNEYVK